MQYDASGFDDDLEDVASGVKAADVAFSRHPRGRFPGVVADIVKKDLNGQPLWEILIQTEAGMGQFTLWGWKPGEVAQAKQQASVGNDQKLKQIQQSMARHKRLFVDLGLPEPESWAKGENSILARLGELKGCACTLVVQPDRQDPNKDRVFVNRPGVPALGWPANDEIPPPTHYDPGVAGSDIPAY